MSVSRFLFALLIFLFTPVIGFSQAEEWQFVRVTILDKKASIDQGTAKLTIKGNIFTARVFVDDYELAFISGTIKKNRVFARYTINGSDYTIKAPYLGSFTRILWDPKENGSKGRECFALNDGMNSISIFRELAP